MMSNNRALARFITSLGSFNEYGSTLLQTKEALDLRSTKVLKQDGDDVAIFEDALKGIGKIKQLGFNTDGIIAVNKEFDSKSDEQPKWPGHLRNAYYNEDDRIGIATDSKTHQAFVPKDQITRTDLDEIVNQYDRSTKKERDAWVVFARLAKLQPFQDGNKRTALIVANAAYGSLESEDYLVVPFDDLDRADFMLGLMRYYVAQDEESEEKAFDRMMSVLPSTREREMELSKPIVAAPQNVQTIRLKPQFRK